jgi:hypothetical protein
MTEIGEPCKRVVSALNGQDSRTLILAAKLVIAMLERNINAEQGVVQ